MDCVGFKNIGRNMQSAKTSGGVRNGTEKALTLNMTILPHSQCGSKRQE